MTKDAEDLSARARHGLLGEDEEARLRRLLRGSAEARLLHRAGIQFDGEDYVQPGDEALAERITERLLAEEKPLAFGRRRSFRLLVAAAVFGTTAAAAMTPLVRQIVLSAPQRAAPPRPSATLSTPESARRRMTESPQPAKPALMAAPSASVNPDDPARARVPLAETTSATSGDPTTTRVPGVQRHKAPSTPAEHKAPRIEAGELYASANRARRDGDLAEAIRRYEEVQRRFPRSPEGNAADLSLGLLLSRTGGTDSAITHLRSYLARSPRGQLMPEALWALGEAYRLANDVESAQDTWATLLDRYPDSAYAAAARAKLGSESSK